MKTKPLLGVLIVAGGLLFLSACSDDDDNQTPVPTATKGAPTNTATASATAVPPTAAPTNTATLPPPTATAPPATSTATEQPTASPTPTVTTEPTATPTQGGGQALGTHAFTISRNGSCNALGEANSCFFTTAVPFEVGTDPWLPGPIRLVGGVPGANGIADVTLAEDVIIGFKQPLAAQCFKLIAAGTTGHIDCDGGSPNDVSLTLNSNGTNPGDSPPTVATGFGADGGSGALTLVVMLASGDAQTVEGCAAAEFGQATATPFTTGTGTSIVLNPRQGSLDPFAATGINISCATWAAGGGSPGRLIVPLTSEDIPVLNFDTEAILQLQEE